MQKSAPRQIREWWQKTNHEIDCKTEGATIELSKQNVRNN